MTRLIWPRSRLSALALGLLLAATAACGPADAPESAPATDPAAGAPAPAMPALTPTTALVMPTPTPIVHEYPDIKWQVAPSLEEQIFTSSVIVRASLQSATATTETVPSSSGVAPTYRPVQELRFTAHEYLKGSGPTTLLVVVRGIHTYLTAAEAQADADFAVARRVTVWDNRQGVLFLQTPAEPYTAAAASASASSLQFTRSNFHREQEWDYSVDTLSRAWLPARDAGGAEGSTGTSDSAFITDGAASPPPVVSLTDLRTKIATMAAELQAGEGIEGYAECLQGKILRERYNRADPLTPLQLVATLASGASAGTEVHKRKNEYRDPRYNRYWLSGPDKDRFQARIIDDDDQAVTGYDHALVTARPLPAGAYQVRYNSQHHRRFPCNYVPDDAYTGFTVTVTAPPDTVHEAFFDPVAIGAAVGADGRHGVLDPTAFTVASTAATIRRLDWAGGSVRLDLSAPVVLAGHELEFIRPDGSVGLRLDLGQATATGLADGGRRLTWAPCPQPWRAGDTLMLRLRSSGASIGAVSCTPAPPLTPTPTATPTAP